MIGELLAIWHAAPLWAKWVLGVLGVAAIVALGTWYEVRRCEREGYFDDDHPDKEAGA